MINIQERYIEYSGTELIGSKSQGTSPNRAFFCGWDKQDGRNYYTAVDFKDIDFTRFKGKKVKKAILKVYIWSLSGNAPDKAIMGIYEGDRYVQGTEIDTQVDYIRNPPEDKSLSTYYEFDVTSVIQKWIDYDTSVTRLTIYPPKTLGINSTTNAYIRALAKNDISEGKAFEFIAHLGFPPSISGKDEDLGNISDEISKTYTVFDEDDDKLSIVERLNNTVINVHNDVKSGTTKTLKIPKGDIYALPIGQKNTISIEVSDGQEKSYRIWTFTRTNTAPIIQLLTENNLGEIIAPFETKIKVTDPEGDATDLVYTVNQVALDEDKANEYKRVPIHTDKKEGIILGTEITYTMAKEIWDILQLGDYELEIKAIDSQGGESKEIIKFTRTEDEINITTKPIETEIMAKQIITLPRISGNPTNFKIMACNNAFDEIPTWEDITEQALNTQPYNFANTTKTADKWGIAVKFEIDGKEVVG